MLAFREQISNILSTLTGLDAAEAASYLEIPPEPGMGEYSFPCYLLARQLRKAPQAIASELAAKIEPDRYLGKAISEGPYLNFYVDRLHLFKQLIPEIVRMGTAYGKEEKRHDETIVVDYSAPNIAKPFGVGHLRSTVIGNALCRLYIALGYHVMGINHLGDWGTQFGKLIVAYRRWGESSKLEKDPVHYLYQLYVLFHREAEKEPDLDEEARQWFRKLEMNDKEAMEIWERFRGLSLEEFKRIYNFLGIKFDSFQGESFYNHLLEDTINLAVGKGLARESDGALLADLEPHGMPPCLLRKKDGAALYITRDLAAAIYRHEQYHFQKLVYVVGAEQTLHFKQLFKIIELLGYTWSKHCVHVPFGLIHFKDGRMSTREGNVIFLEDVLNRAIEMAHRIIQEKNPDLHDKEEAARMVGLGAVIFGDLINDRIKDIEFDWDKVLDFSGETAPYVQYAHARICSILRKAGQDGNAVAPETDDSLLLSETGFLSDPEEEQLLITMARFKEQIRRSAADYRPSHMARYLVDLARDFNKFYHNCPVLNAPESLRKNRFLLIEGVRIVIKNGLDLLGIEAPEEM